MATSQMNQMRIGDVLAAIYLGQGLSAGGVSDEPMIRHHQNGRERFHCIGETRAKGRA